MPAPPEGQAATAAPPSDRVRLRRKRERGSYDRATIDAILDEALIAHLGIVDEDGQPFVIRPCTRAAAISSTATARARAARCERSRRARQRA